MKRVQVVSLVALTLTAVVWSWLGTVVLIVAYERGVPVGVLFGAAFVLCSLVATAVIYTALKLLRM